MLTWDKQRQIFYGVGAFFVIVLVFAYPAYQIFHKTPTCFDGGQNQNETGIDCGGICANACVDSLTPLSTKWARYFKVGNGVYDVAASIENKNSTAGIENLTYTFTLYDADGVSIAEKKGEAFVNPREELILFAPTIRTNGKVPSRATLSIDQNPVWLQVTPHFDTRLTVRDQSLSGKDERPQITATIVNNSPDSLRNIDAVAVVYGGRGDPVGVSSGVIEYIKGDGSAPAKFFWPLPFAAKPTNEATCVAPVDAVLVFDRSGSMRGKPLEDAKNAAALFVENLTREDQVALVSFATEASKPIDSTLSFDHGEVVAAALRIVIGEGMQYTNLGDGIASASTELASSRARKDVKRAIIALTDGVATMPENPTNKNDKVYPETFAGAAASEAKKGETALYVIGLGRDLNSGFLQNTIASTPLHYYAATSSSELAGIYKQIAAAVCKEEIFTTKVFPRVKEVGI